MSRFAAIRNRVAGALGKGDESSEIIERTEPTEEEVTKEEAEVSRSEKFLIHVLELVRQLYIQRRLVGEVEISRSLLSTENTLCCEIDGTAEQGAQEFASTADSAKTGDTDVETLPLLVRVTVKNADRLLRRLASRAKVYAGKPYKSDLTVSSSINISVSGFTGASISLSATVDSLLASAAPLP
ncbi:hypothetical protein B484DRAFT_404995 [Ochromonadaceae sp. CCMP2298]|nr:hypothetical protein B484DRAFT_404995 [Ochromonadaceae sp. CCMP2298]|mmetsp:Transcript_26524/g.57213  ORF Transcript_26524/g.57213 Transcript_26524/m.57213 type:complete len:184 (+) Transcript_26524:131-682(+)